MGVPAVDQYACKVVLRCLEKGYMSTLNTTCMAHILYYSDGVA